MLFEFLCVLSGFARVPILHCLIACIRILLYIGSEAHNGHTGVLWWVGFSELFVFVLCLWVVFSDLFALVSCFVFL